MNVIGIIAEYNPFHNGHIYQIETIRAKYPKSRIVALMSGSFTQRGCPAILDKWQRASHAVLGGIDLVLELPAAFAVRSAQNFFNAQRIQRREAMCRNCSMHTYKKVIPMPLH